MGTPGPEPRITLEDTLRVFDGLDRPSTPLTAPEVAVELGCARRTAYRKLERLAERGALETKKVGAHGRIWWRPIDDTPVTGGRESTEPERFDEFVRAVEDYAIFVLDPEGNVASWNDGAERIKGYAEEDVLGEHFSMFYTDADRREGVPEANLEVARSVGRVEDEGWRVREDDTEFWAHVVITAIRDDDGNLQGYTKVTRDLTERREYEERLQKEYRLVDRVLETAPVSIAVVTTDGELVRANPRVLERLGIEETDLERYAVEAWPIFDEDGEPIPSDERPWQRVGATGDPVFDFQCQVDLPHIGRRWVSINAAPLDPPESDENRVVLAVDDVTERRENERQLERRKHELETELGEILGRISDAFCALDEEWRFVLVNDRAETLLQHSREELVGASIWEVFPDASETVAWDRLHDAVGTNEPVSFEVEYDPLDIWVEINAYPSATGLSIYFREISERKAHERELERYRTIVETVEDGVYTVDPTGRFTMVNDAYAEMTGYTREELVGSHVSLVVDDEIVESAREVEEELKFGDDERAIEADLRRADGSTFPAEATFALLPSDDGYERIGVVRDVTERVRYRDRLEETVEKLEASNERLEQFASVASHDLRNPLSVAQGRVELARMECDSDHLDEVERAHERMQVLIENLLALAREGRTVTEFEPVVLADVVEECWRTVETADARLDVSAGSSIRADRDRLRQLLENLIRNCVEHGGDEVGVRVGALEGGFYVEDDGPGIPVDERGSVLESGYSTTEDGTGFGLSIVQQIADAHGWTISVTEGTAGGARFEITGVERVA